MIWFLIIILFAMTVGFAIFKIGDAFSPWMITLAVWLGIFLLFGLFGHNLYPPQSRLYNCVMIWIPIFVVSSIGIYYALPSASACEVRQIELSDTAYRFFLVVAMVCSPLYLYQVVKVAMMFDLQNLANNIRIFSSYGEKDSLTTLLKYVCPVNQALFIVEMWRYPNGSKKGFYATLAANLFCMVAVMAKGPIFILAVSTVYILYEKKKIRLSSIFMWGIILLVCFYGLNVLRRPEDEKDGATFMDFFSMYVLSPSVAFEWAQEKLTDQFGSFSFAFFYAFASKLGLGSFYVQKQLQDFVFVPIPTNVYTVFQPYFEDFGYKGVAFFASVWGLLSGWLYRLVKNGVSLAMCMYAYVAFALVMQFYQESLFVNLSIVIQYLVIFTLLIKHDISFSFRGISNIRT